MPEMKIDLNVSKCHLSDFLDAFKGHLGLMTLSEEELKDLELSLKAVRQPLLAIGDGGGGKTEGIMATVAQVNETLKKNPDTEHIHFGFKKIQLGQTIVGDLQGIPVVDPTTGEVRKLTADDLPQTDESKDDFNEYGVLFLDELSSANVEQVQPALGLADGSRTISTYHLPEHWMVVAAGNGPNCSNFVRLDDITVSRFEVFDIDYDYKTDWRPWATTHGILPEIIAFLNLEEKWFIAPIKDDMRKPEEGKQYPCPRTWEKLSNAIKIHKALNNGDFPSDIASFASRSIGKEAARNFASFCKFREKVAYDTEKILAGTEKLPKKSIDKEVYQLVVQRCVMALQKELEGKGTPPVVEGGDWTYPQELVKRTANFFDWLLELASYELDPVVKTLIYARNTSEDISHISLSMYFEQICPKFNKFTEDNQSLIASIQGNLKEM